MRNLGRPSRSDFVQVRLLSRLNHPNIVKIIASNLVADQKFYVMTLYQCSLTERPLSPQQSWGE